MDELEISGKRYISTRRAAREHGYHSDYMGQLIRSGKVIGQKVGRAWYIDEASLTVYFGAEQKPAEPEAVMVAPVVEVAPTPQQAADRGPDQSVGVEETPEAPAPIIEVSKEESEPVAEVIKIAEVPEEKVFITKVQEPEEIYIETKSTRVPIHTVPVAQHVGGLRYAADNSPSMPVVSRMPQKFEYTPLPVRVAHAVPAAPRQKFPVISLSVVALIALLGAAFASNFVSATIISEPGKSAVVQYAIHW